jgi:hypothetical protein
MVRNAFMAEHAAFGKLAIEVNFVMQAILK